MTIKTRFNIAKETKTIRKQDQKQIFQIIRDGSKVIVPMRERCCYNFWRKAAHK
jgi:hypothetical protein